MRTKELKNKQQSTPKMKAPKTKTVKTTHLVLSPNGIVPLMAAVPSMEHLQEIIGDGEPVKLKQVKLDNENVLWMSDCAINRYSELNWQAIMFIRNHYKEYNLVVQGIAVIQDMTMTVDRFLKEQN